MKITITHLTKKKFQEQIAQTTVFFGYHELPTTLVFICATELGIINAILCDTYDKEMERATLQQYPHKQPFEAGHLAELLSCPVISVVLVGTDFQAAVWQAAIKIPAGSTTTYHELAELIGKNKAHRAVANALAKNDIAYFIPCHRIIRKDGSLGGFRWGLAKKSALLADEKNCLQ